MTRAAILPYATWLAGFMGAALAAVALLLLSSCRGGCSADGVLAELTGAQGSVQRDTASTVTKWTGAELGAEFRMGDGLRTGPKAEAHLELAGGSHVRVESDTIIRFRESADKGSPADVGVELGSAEISAGDQPVHVTTEVGTAVVASRGTLRVSSDEKGFRFLVTVGQVVLQKAGGGSETLGEGQSLEIGIGNAVIEKQAPTKPPPPERVAKPDAGPTTGPIRATVAGRNASKKAPGDRAFGKLGPGEATLEENTVVRLGAGTTVAIARGSEQATLVGSGEFLVGAEDGALVAVRSGKVTFEDSASSVRISAPGGTIVAAAESAGDVAVGRDTTKVAVRARQAVVKSAAGEEVIEAGQEAVLEHGGAAVVEGRSLDYADIVFAAGQSAIVHDPKPPTAVGFTLSDKCAEGGVVFLKGKGKQLRVRGGNLTSLAIPAGSYAYEVSCIREGAISDAVDAQGRMTILADAGTAPLPKSAPATGVDADGRNYTVLYQNHLPAVSVAWPRPPKASSYSLIVKSGTQTRTLSAGGPSYSFASGQLAEGTHRLQFTSNSGAKSKTTTVSISFDNVAPKATLRSPADGSFGPGASVTVSGAALPGWSVRAGGEPYPVDAQFRFSGQAVAPADRRALDIVFSHPSRGAHHYLRRSSAAN